MEIKERLKPCLMVLQNTSVFNAQLTRLLQITQKNYLISNIVPLFNLARQMVTCLVIDYFISIFQPKVQDIKFLGELHRLKAELVNKIKQHQSILTMQGQMKQSSKFQSLSIIVTKMAKEILGKNKPPITEDQLFKRLSFILNGTNISKKCYKLSLNRVAQNLSIQTKNKNMKKQRHTISSKQKTLFKQIFLSLNDINHEKKIKVDTVKQLTDSNKLKINNIIQKVRKTIEQENKKFQPSDKKSFKKSQSGKVKINDSLFIQGLEKQTSKQIKIDLNDVSRKIAYSRSKKTNTEKQNGRSKLLLQLINSQSIYGNQFYDATGNQFSLQSVPGTDANWYQPSKKTRIKRILTLYLPKICQRSMQIGDSK